MPENFDHEQGQFEQAHEQFAQDGPENEVEGHFFSSSFGFHDQGAEGFATGSEFPQAGFQRKPEDPSFGR